MNFLNNHKSQSIVIMPWDLFVTVKTTFVNCDCKYSKISSFLRTFASDFNKICDMIDQIIDYYD